MFNEFRGISQISDATTAKRMKIGQYCQRQRCKHVELGNFWQTFTSRGVVSDSWAFLFGTVSVARLRSTAATQRRLVWPIREWSSVTGLSSLGVWDRGLKTGQTGLGLCSAWSYTFGLGLGLGLTVLQQTLRCIQQWARIEEVINQSVSVHASCLFIYLLSTIS